MDETRESSDPDESDMDIQDYYDFEDDFIRECDLLVSTDDPEYFEYVCMDVDETEQLFNDMISRVACSTTLSESQARLLLYLNNWNVDSIIKQCNQDGLKMLPENNSLVSSPCACSSLTCLVCFSDLTGYQEMKGLGCHFFCIYCWKSYFHSKLSAGISTSISCMGNYCDNYCPEQFVLSIIGDDDHAFRSKYKKLIFKDCVESNPMTRFCSGADCTKVIYAQVPKAQSVTCTSCRISFCFSCGIDYHAPTSCETIRKWLVKSEDDSETANYISANTKDCPKCHSCIEKNGGCNHIQCAKCNFQFCWMCFGEWRSHGNEFYECSRYKEDPNVAQEAKHLHARKALEKYLHYFERYQNHNQSMKLEEKLRKIIMNKINAKVETKEGSWIDWQHLHDAVTVLMKCRYTLKYTYPYAYYLEGGAKKDLFEYQQAQFEKNIEELSWKVERAEFINRADLENQMHAAEMKRRTVLRDFSIH